MRAAARPVVLEIDEAGAGDTGEIKPAMLVEILVLGCEEGVDDQLRYRLYRDVKPSLTRIFGTNDPSAACTRVMTGGS